MIVKNGKVLSKAHNKVEKKQNCTLHAEIIAIKKASKKIKNWRLNECDMYVTLEPCLMCKSAIELSRLKNVYYGIESNNKVIIKEKKYKKNSNKNNIILNLMQNFFKLRR